MQVKYIIQLQLKIHCHNYLHKPLLTPPYELRNYNQAPSIITSKINNTAFNEDFYLIANNNPVYTFEGVSMHDVTMYIQCNNKPTLIVDQNCISDKNTLYFSSEIQATEEEITMWSKLFNNITHGDKLLYPKI